VRLTDDPLWATAWRETSALPSTSPVNIPRSPVI
jgi:hypothetical protein